MRRTKVGVTARVAMVVLLLGACGRSTLVGLGTASDGGARFDGAVANDGFTPPDGATDGFSTRDGLSTGDGMSARDGGSTLSDLGSFGLCPNPVVCENPLCAGDPLCHKTGREICNNGLDDNDDGLVDCADPQCTGSPFCAGLDGGTTTCDSANPNCLDIRCVTNPKCVNLVCMPDLDFGAIAASGARVSRSFDTTQSKRTFSTCAFPGGTAQVGVFQLTQTSSIKIDFSQAAGTAHVVELFHAGTLQPCDANPLFGGCINAGENATATKSYPDLAAGFYYLIVQSYPDTQGSSTVTISTACSGASETCNDGIDNNCDGLIDCADPTCFSASNCIASECVPDINLGTLVPGDPPDMLTLDTTQMVANRYHPTCAGSSTADDVVVRFTLQQTAGILVNWQQTGEHAFGLFQEAASGLACDALQVSCFAMLNQTAGQFAFTPKAPGQYVFIFKPVDASEAGTLQLAISSYLDHGAEICNNGLDDDNNGLIDCADPACLGVPPCNAPLCLVDQDLGVLTPGNTISTTVDTTTGKTLYPTSCSTGTGKEKVLRLTVTQPMGLGVSCTPDPGTHVFQLAAQLQPLDPCNLHNLNCFDPTIIYGCNVEMPDVQPGIYNLIVAAFAAGSEGVVDLSLSGFPSAVVECDTQAECMDPRCATAPACTQFACQPDDKLGILALDGSATSAVVSTSAGAAGADNVGCTTLPNGLFQDVDFQLPAAADLTIQWAQVGNADFALFTDANDLLACDAGTAVNCTASLGAQTGTITLPGLAIGRYHLIVKADQTGQEGGVVLQLKGTPTP